MTSVQRPTIVDDEQAVIEFLGRVLPGESGGPLLAPPVMRWKYWEPRDDFPEPRSYVLERTGRIIAHVGLWPVSLRRGISIERGVQMIDWASDPGAPGAGLALLQRLVRSFDFVYSIGGSHMTVEILPRFGFRRVAEAWTWSRPIRPWRQMFLHQERDWRLPARLLRNAWWSKMPPHACRRDWAAVEIAPAEVRGWCGSAGERNATFFRYLQRCPVAGCRVFRVTEASRERGFFALTTIHRQARVIGVWLTQMTSAHIRVVLELAQDVASRHTNACEVIARGEREVFQGPAAASGMRPRSRVPVYLHRKDASEEALPLQFQIADDDRAFLSGHVAHFLT